jgi:hypothetical protein
MTISDCSALLVRGDAAKMVGTRSRAIWGGCACGVVGMRSRASGVAYP